MKKKRIELCNKQKYKTTFKVHIFCEGHKSSLQIYPYINHLWDFNYDFITVCFSFVFQVCVFERRNAWEETTRQRQQRPVRRGGPGRHYPQGGGTPQWGLDPSTCGGIPNICIWNKKGLKNFLNLLLVCTNKIDMP